MKEKIRILVTDSGLGGLSVAAELYERIRMERGFEKADVVFFNCRLSNESGYDQLPDDDARAAVFSKALYAMTEKFQPDVIMIACNTLSVVYDRCDYSKDEPVPVIGIIEDGVNDMERAARSKPGMNMVMFGTPTTVRSNTHKKLLMDKGISSRFLHYKDCRGLPADITRGDDQSKLRISIDELVGSANRAIDNAPFGISLLCTHFSFVGNLFFESASKFVNFTGDMINPNSTLIGSFLKKYSSCDNSRTVASIECYTHTTISMSAKDHVSSLLGKTSLDAADALRRIVETPDLF